MPNSAHRTPADRAPAREPSRARGRVPESLVLLTRDRTLFQTVRVVSANHSLATVVSEGDLANQLAAGNAGVAIVDAAAAASPITDLTERLAAQFPDLVLVVAGDSRDQGLLTSQITAGTVHRFLHKPVSEQRVRLFVDAAWRRHEQELIEPERLNPPTVYPPGEHSSRRVVWIGVVVAAFLASAAGAWLTFVNDSPVPAREAAVATTTGANYRQAASAPIADDGQSAELERLLGEAEQALLAERIDEAERLASAARTLQPDHARVAFLQTQIGKERERALLTRARRAAASGDVEAAIALLEGTAGRKGSTLVAETRRELEQRKVEEQVTDYLRRAEERASAGALIEPTRNNARFFIQSAQALAPDTETVRAAQRSLADRLLESSRVSLAASDAAGAERWIDAAQETGADAARIGPLRRELQRVQAATRAASFARLVSNFNERLGDGRLREPAGNSAKHWLGRLLASDPAHAATKAARESYASRALAEGGSAVSSKDFDAADGWLAEARSSSAPAAETAALEQEIARARQASSVVDASVLKRVRYVEPRYPDDARARDSGGWVELEFTVATDGAVGNIAVTHSEPAGVFDAAAVNAVRKWRYRPMVSGGAPVEQRARLRIRFTLE